MNTRVDEMAEQLLQIKHEAEQAEARVERVTQCAAELERQGVLEQHVMLGPVLEHANGDDQQNDLGKVVRGAFLVPEGFGLCTWRSEEYVQQQELPDGLESNACQRFQPFHQCTAAEKKSLLPFIEELQEDLADLALIADSKQDPGPGMDAADYFAQRRRDDLEQE